MDHKNFLILSWASTNPFNYCHKTCKSQPSAFSGIGIIAITDGAFKKFGPVLVIPVTQFSAEVQQPSYREKSVS